eukprot:TRINITY_DN1464_c0_g1_i2.p1 TRINITY_DN1464_c0_g1~~TRINITY_DN1464_c0_g1_i2.p1  ORF type:complete len:291 (-),score=54.10 TRINITY_DN1464_c0_g1_i2:756-1628(-)
MQQGVIVTEYLCDIERKYDVKILFSCEAGSRAYGIHSESSDYDVRFVYVNPLRWYLTTSETKRDDIIEEEIASNSEKNHPKIELKGWEVKKTLQLCKKSNATLYEWFSSPITYSSYEPFVSKVRTIILSNYSQKGISMHWRSIATNNIKGYINVHDVKYKQYLYVIRPLLFIKWMMVKGKFPPLNFVGVFEDLAAEKALSPIIEQYIRDLLDQKMSGEYMGEGRHNLDLEKWFSSVLNESLEYYSKSKDQGNMNSEDVEDVLNDLFYTTVITFAKETRIDGSNSRSPGCS